MGWIAENAAAISALGAILMNVSTLGIIFFNMNQVKLNRRSLNVDINFKVFDLRKNIYREIVDMIHLLKISQDFSVFIENIDGNISANEKFQTFKGILEDSQYLFSKALFAEIQRLLFLCEHGVALESRVYEIKEQHIDNWTDETTNMLKELSNNIKDSLECIYEFDAEQIIKYLNVSDFHKDFISDIPSVLSRWSRFNQIIFKPKNSDVSVIKAPKKSWQF